VTLVDEQTVLVAQRFDPHPCPLPAREREPDEDNDALPAVGKVWEDNGGPSLSELLRQQEQEQPGTPQFESNVEPVAPTDLENLFQRLLSELAAKGPSLPALVAGAQLVGIEDGTAILRYSQDHAPIVRMLDRNGKKDTIRDILSGLLKKTVGLKFELVESAPAAATTTTTAPPQPPHVPQRTPVHRTVPAPPPPPPEAPTIRITEELRAQLRNDELIKTAIEKLGAEIVRVE